MKIGAFFIHYNFVGNFSHFLSPKEIMACPLRHYLGYFYWLAAFVGAIAVVFGMKDSRLYDVSSGGSDESSSKTAKKKR